MIAIDRYAVRHPLLLALARTLNAAFFVATSIDCLLVYSPFTFEQFVKPQVSAGLTNFTVWHADLHWLVLSITTLTLAPYLERSRARTIGFAYLAASAGLGLWLSTHPVLAEPRNAPVYLLYAVIALAPPIWLSVFDHLAADVPAGPSPSNDRRTLTASLLTATFIWAMYVVAVPVQLGLAGGIELSPGGVILGVVVSGIGHLTLFTILWAALAAISRGAALTRAPGRVEYALIAAFCATVMCATIGWLVLAPIAITGLPAWMMSASLGVTIAAVWSGIARYRVAGAQAPPGVGREKATALDWWLAPIVTGESRTAAIAGLVSVAAGAHFLIGRVGNFDWDFMLQKLVALVSWLAAFGFVHAMTRGRTAPRLLWIAPGVVLILLVAEGAMLPNVPVWLGDVRLNSEFVLDGYAALSPSFRVIRDMTRHSTGKDAAEFYRYLRANTTIQAPVHGVDIDLAPRGSRAAVRPPHLFFFIVDSLRRDYLSSYNPAVTFTPEIQKFADDSFVYTRTLSRYGGTALSVPAIWAGAMILHKEYVTPFAPMNALEKLVDANGYQRFITEDHITDALFARSPATVALDHGTPEMLHTLCGTISELETDLARADRTRPIFALTRPLALHIANVYRASVPPGESYPGFFGPSAARVRHLDACFGHFVETLKRLRLYDESIIVLMADHGDSLGEGGLWGHAYTVFPEVLRIPLIIHVPQAIRQRFMTDLTRVSFSTDVTPTLYALLGEPPVARGPLFGAPLVMDPAGDGAARRRESYLVASSYGAVYGLVQHDGRRLYIADAIQGRDYTYDLSPRGAYNRVVISDAERLAARQMIRQQVKALADWYGFTPEP